MHTKPWSAGPGVHGALSPLIRLELAEVAPVLCSFFALFSCLASYFLLLPLREDAGIALGTSVLPRLMAGSLILTLVVTPAATAFLSRPNPAQRERALRQFFTCMAAVLLGFYCLYSFSDLQSMLDSVRDPQQHFWQPWQLRQRAAGAHHHQWKPGGDASQQQEQQQVPAARHLLAVDDPHPAQTLLQLQQQPMGTNSSSSSTAQLDPREPASSNVVSSKPLRLLQAHASAAGSPAEAGSSGGSTAGEQAASSSGSSSDVGRQRVSRRHGDPSLTTAGRFLRAAFYIYVNCMNLIAISSIWARCADAFPPEAGARLFGFISAGATLGQLSGSLVAVCLAWASEAVAARSHGSSSSSTAGNKPAAGLILISALLQLFAAHLVCKIRPAPAFGLGSQQQQQQQNGHTELADDSVEGGFPVAAGRPLGVTLTSAGSLALGRAFVSSAGGGSSAAGVAAPGSSANGSRAVPVAKPQLRRQRSQHFHRVLSGFQLIAKSSYLQLLCLNLMLTYMSGSLIYFQRALVVAKAVKGAAHRTTFFAVLNTYSASAVLLLQLTAASGMLRMLGVPVALALGPGICLCGMIAVCWWPSPSVVSGFEVLRKVFAYAVNRPAREVLFTVVSRDEKYAAKLVIDTCVQRLGDAIAAAAFQVLDVQLALGQAGVAAAGCVICVVWLGVAVRLGQHHNRLACS